MKKNLKRSSDRCILLLLDGLGDRSYPELGDKTPLQTARTPNLDALAKRGTNGLLHAAGHGIALPSENAHFALFGYGTDEFPGRGILEALGTGIEVGSDEVAFLAHFIHAQAIDDILYVESHRPQASEEEAGIFIQSIKNFTADGIKIIFHQTKCLDGILCLSGDVSRRVTDTDPVQSNCPMIAAMPLHTEAVNRQAIQTAEALNAYISWCYRTLSEHSLNKARQKQNLPPINAIVTQRPGRLIPVQPFPDRWGLKAVSIASGLVYWGLARFLGMEINKVKDTDDPGADLAERLRLAASLGHDFEFIHVHTKAPDAAAHTKDPKNKVAVIESLDAGIGKGIDAILDGRTTLIITADHSTPSAGPLVHSGEPVPIAVAGPGVRVDAVKGFDEIQCASGALGNVRGNDFMPMVLNLLDLAKLKGLMDTPDDQPYWPGRRTPFRLKG